MIQVTPFLLKGLMMKVNGCRELVLRSSRVGAGRAVTDALITVERSTLRDFNKLRYLNVVSVRKTVGEQIA